MKMQITYIAFCFHSSIAESIFPTDLAVALVAIIIIHFVVYLYDKYNPNANYHWNLIFEGKRDQAQTHDDILMENFTLLSRVRHSGKSTISLILDKVHL